jgi:hypothetical protein
MLLVRRRIMLMWLRGMRGAVSGARLWMLVLGVRKRLCNLKWKDSERVGSKLHSFIVNEDPAF